MEAEKTKNIYHLFVKLLDGKTLTLRFNSPTISGGILNQHLQNLSQIPQHHHNHLLLLSEGRHITSETLISSNEQRLFPTVHVLLRLLGGKGGFGSLLRGAATKAGQKKTNNFDACRDMSGRRLRHVNAEKKLEEWRLEEGERKLEKKADEYLKKKAKKAKGNVSGDSAEKYVEKYREMSAKCVAEVEVAVREAIGNGKRRAMGKEGLDAKRLKIWKGKKKLDDSDSDDMDEDENDNVGGNESSAVLSNGNHSHKNEEIEGSSSFVSCEQLNGVSSVGGLCESGSEEDKGATEPEIHELVQSNTVSLKDVPISRTEVAADECKMGNLEEAVAQPAINFTEEKEAEIIEENTSTKPEVEKPLNFDDYKSAVELEVLGMERLKSELQTRGLKCGGMLQERAARLFLLKTTSLEKLPKKLLAKK